MHLNSNYHFHDVAGEHIAVPLNPSDDDLSKVIAFNDTSMALWNHFQHTNFTLDDVVSFLTSEYDVPFDRASADAANWISILKDNDLVFEE